MGIFTRLKNGWTLGKTSLRTIKENPSLMLFPVISGTALLLVSIVILGGGAFLFGDSLDRLSETESGAGSLMIYLGLFIFYLINYFVIVFFNVGLVHCAKKINEGRATDFGEGVRFALTKIGAIFS